MENSRVFALILVVILVSFLGFVVENIFTLIMGRKIDNRNMILPFLLGYGLSILVIYRLFGTPNSPLLFGKEIEINHIFFSIFYYFSVTFLCVSIGELILGHLIERTCQIKWWNYSNLPLHITRYTSIPTSTLFAVLITLFMKFLFSPLLSYFSRLNPRMLSITAVSLIVLLSIDFVHSAIYMFTNHKILQIWKYEFKNKRL